MANSTRLSPKRLYSVLVAAGVLCMVWTLSGTKSTTGLAIDPIARYFINYPLEGPTYGHKFGELGQRVQILTQWVLQLEEDPKDISLRRAVEEVTLSTFPFLRRPSDPDNPAPLSSLRESIVPGSHGIVIPVGVHDFRYACHLILTLRKVLHSTLPIQIAYAGEDDLPLAKRDLLQTLEPTIEFVDVTWVLDNKNMQLEKGWAIKPFAVLASTFEQVILLDADSVFLQPPESLLFHTGFQETGTLLFHDRLLWQHSFQERHKWWKQEMKHQEPSNALKSSLVWSEDYAEEADSGVVLWDKSRLPVFMALLHVCWQNMKPVREETTYKMTYGDKESWWFGLELCDVPHFFEKHYGAVLGENRLRHNKEDVCGFTIAHVDEKEKLIWYNGSLLKNKAIDNTTFLIPSHWMIDATWEKGATKADMSCMTGGMAQSLTNDEMDILRRSIVVAKEADSRIE